VLRPSWNPARHLSAGLALWILSGLLWGAVHHGATRAWFHDDDLDTISYADEIPLLDYGRYLLSPRFQPNNFRPAAILAYRTLHEAFGLDYPKWVLALQAVHWLNVGMLWLLARRAGAGPVAASAGALVFAFHPALFDPAWKAMYLMDLGCGALCLASLLAYAHRRWMLSFAAFWLAYKMKEVAVMLPAVLLLWEMWLGGRRPWRVAPFLLVSLSFGLQGVLLNPHRDDAYTLRFTWEALAATAPFYAAKLGPWLLAGCALALALAWRRSPGLRIGWAALVLFLIPMLVLPGRLFAAYCYVPAAGLGLAVASLAALDLAVPAVLVAVLLAAASVREVRPYRRATLQATARYRTYFSTLAAETPRLRQVRRVLYDGLPPGFHEWGLAGSLRYLLGRQDTELFTTARANPSEFLRAGVGAYLQWEDPPGRLHVFTRRPDAPPASYLRMAPAMAFWQLGEGWYELEKDYRWTGARAAAELTQPAGAAAFELRVNVSPELHPDTEPIRVAVTLDGEPVDPPFRFSSSGWVTMRRAVKPLAEPRTRRVELRVDPVRRFGGDQRELGIAVGALGFPPAGGLQ
jgi:hypothetical protein